MVLPCGETRREDRDLAMRLKRFGQARLARKGNFHVQGHIVEDPDPLIPVDYSTAARIRRKMIKRTSKKQDAIYYVDLRKKRREVQDPSKRPISILVCPL